MEARTPEPPRIHFILLSVIILLGTVSTPGCWDLVWPPAGSGSEPTVDAGADRRIHEGDTVTLIASASDDGDIVRYTWEQTSGRALNYAAWEGLPLADGDSPSLSLDIPWLREGEEGQVELTVTVTDDEGNTASDTVALTIEQRHFVIFKGVDRSRPGADDEPFRALYRVDLEDGDPTVLHPYLRSEEITGFRISPTGEYVAFNLLRNDDFNLYVVTTDGGDAKVIDSGGYLDQNWRWSPTGKQLAYLAAHTCNCAEEMELYIAASSGNSSKITNELTAARTVDAFQWASDGSAIAWSALDPDSGERELFISPAIGSGTSATSVSTKLATPDITKESFQWSPYCGEQHLPPFGGETCDANEIAYVADNNSTGRFELFVAPVNGYPSWRVSGDLIPEGNVTAFEWAAGGVRIAYTATRRFPAIPELFVTDHAGGIDYLITPPGSGNTRSGRAEAFRWAPDGVRIAYLFSQGMASDAPAELRTALWNGNDDISITGDLPAHGNVRNFTWSADGSYLAYTVDIRSPSATHLFISAADGSTNEHISDFMVDGASVDRFLWSPDGTYVAFTADATLLTFDELFVSTIDGNVTRISDEALPLPPDRSEVADDFRWLPDGSHIVYRTRFGTAPEGVAQLLASPPASNSSRTLAGEPVVVGSFELN